MKITLPKFIQRHPDEGVKLFVAFMYRMAKRDKNGFKGTRYYMHASDIRYFLRKYVVAPNNHITGIDGWMRIGKANSDIWMIEWRARPDVVKYDLTDAEATAVWGYVLGRESLSEIVSPWEGNTIPDRQVDQLKDRDANDFFSYL